MSSQTVLLRLFSQRMRITSFGFPLNILTQLHSTVIIGYAAKDGGKKAVKAAGAEVVPVCTQRKSVSLLLCKCTAVNSVHVIIMRFMRFA